MNTNIRNNNHKFPKYRLWPILSLLGAMMSVWIAYKTVMLHFGIIHDINKGNVKGG